MDNTMKAHVPITSATMNALACLWAVSTYKTRNLALFIIWAPKKSNSLSQALPVCV
jgi:hypothetical protein